MHCALVILCSSLSDTPHFANPFGLVQFMSLRFQQYSVLSTRRNSNNDENNNNNNKNSNSNSNSNKEKQTK
eukprot:6480542-Amphidinium_carterae.1